MRLLCIHPGASWSTADVEAGLRYGLNKHGVQVIEYRLDTRIARSKRWLTANWRLTRRTNPSIPMPTDADMIYQAGIGAIEKALRNEVDAVLVVSAMLLHPDVIILMKRAGLKVFIVFTESPYDLDKEGPIAKLVDGCWTNERTAVAAFRALNPRSGYLPSAWHPQRHRPDAPVGEMPAHDVVFVGTGFSERARWFDAINWTGIDLGLYGNWREAPLSPRIRACVRDEVIDNVKAVALYRRARISLNLYRRSMGWGHDAPQLATGAAESLSPRAYELAACGAFHLSDERAEVSEVFGDLVPTFRTPAQAEYLIRQWLPDGDGRARVSAQLPACVAESSWVDRAACVIGDVQSALAGRNVTAVAV
jgi:spore maturation protein CgeB